MSLLEKEKKLSKITITDDLTGLFNRRHFNNILMHSIQYARQSGQKMAMLLIDIDFFKSVNDTYGHQKGDEVLRVLGDIIKEALRKSDFPCRIGGEEFAVLMPGTNISEALVVGERIRKEFAGRPFKSFSDKTFFSTVSAGVGQYKDGETGHEFFEKTDKALYQAKKQGRNRIVTT
jgi:two-component system cell cycle response regulator